MSKSFCALGLLSLATLMFASVQPASAGAVTKVYELPTIVFSLSGEPDPTGGTEDGTLDIGAVRFSVAEYNRRRTVDIRVLDVVNPFGQVALFACQDLDDDTSCGEDPDGITQFEDEPDVSGCLTGGLSAGSPKLTIAGLDVTKGQDSDLVVFIFASDLCPNSALGGGTSGELRITFA